MVFGKVFVAQLQVNYLNPFIFVSFVYIIYNLFVHILGGLCNSRFSYDFLKMKKLSARNGLAIFVILASEDP